MTSEKVVVARPAVSAAGAETPRRRNPPEARVNIVIVLIIKQGYYEGGKCHG